MTRFSAAIAATAVLACASSMRADDEAVVKDILTRAIKAQGGAEALAKIKAGVIRYTGKFHLGDDVIDYTGTLTFQAPDRRKIETVSETSGREFKYIEVVDGDRGWVVLSGKVEAMAKEQLAEVREELHAVGVAGLTPLLTVKGFKVSPLGESKVGEKEAVGIRVEFKGRRDVNLYFDRKTGLLLKRENRARDPLSGKEYVNEVSYGDYRKVGDVQLAHRIAIRRDGVLTIESQTTEFKSSEKLDSTLFGKP
jgi:outer membrane lipoprotein-sorting protein